MGKRRGAYEGSIYLRNDARWCSVIDLGWKNGKRKRKAFYGKTRREVAEKLNKAPRDRTQGLSVSVERQTLSQFLKMWLVESVKPSVRPLTYEQYEQHVRLYIDPAIGMLQLSKLSPQHVQQLINAKLKEGMSPRTMQITLFVLRRALAQAVKWDFAIRNVAELVDRPKVEPKEIIPPSMEQIQKLLEKLKGKRFEAMFKVALALGMRRGEVLGLRWEDVDFEAGTISVGQALQRSGGRHVEGQGARSKLRFVAPKSFRGIRTIGLPECVAKVLRAHKARQAGERLQAGSQWLGTNLIFTTGIGTPIEPRKLDREFKRALTEAELPESIRLHDSRHFAASLLLALGVPPRTVMEILGHSDISVTMNTYGHVVSESMREAAAKIDQAFGS